MGAMNRIGYVELPAADAEAVGKLKDFYAKAMGWSFDDWGPTYAAFTAGIPGGLNGEPEHRAATPLVIMESDDLEAAEAGVRAAGGTVTLEPFAYPGGRRFHFRDPAGNELAVMQVDQ